MNRPTQPISYRTYNMPLGSPVLAMLEKDFQPDSAGRKDSLHFHNYMEIGFCYYGHGSMTMGSETMPYSSNMFTIIPPNIPHMTEITDKTGCSWEYLMLDVDELLSALYKNTPPPIQKTHL